MKQGELVGLRGMYGYVIDKNSVTIHPAQAETVRRIFNSYASGESSIEIARRLIADDIPSLLGGEWTAKRVREILRNEKYTGNALLQKTYISDYLTKRKIVNHGELPQYFVTQTHEAIIDQDTFDLVQKMLIDSSERNLPTKPGNARYPLTGKIVCGNCGKHFQRKTTKGRISWLCSTYLEHGKSACPAKQIPEGTILHAAADVLGQDSFDEREFSQKVERIEVPGPNRLRFILYNGLATECEWRHRSRSESWTDEMRQKAREKDHERRRGQSCQR
jgi:hypothetical protein